MIQILKRILNSIIGRLALTVIFTIILQPFLAQYIQESLLTVSVILREILIFMIPFIIFSSVFTAFSKMNTHAPAFIAILLAMVVISNCVSVSLGGIFSYFYITNNNNIYGINSETLANVLEPIFNFTIYRFIPNDMALLTAFVSALLYRYNQKKLHILSIIGNNIDKFSNFFLKNIFVPLLPVFICGFLIKLIYDGVVYKMIHDNPNIILLMILPVFGYIIFLYVISTLIIKKPLFYILRNIASPLITGFSTMSSAVALPFSIKAAEIIIKDKEVANAVMPVTVNIHALGDSICIPIMSMTLLKIFGCPMLNFQQYLVFTYMFVLLKFSSAGVPGGGILIMLPVLEKYMGFTPEMSVMITMMYVFMDNILTTCNVIGNNLFVILFNKVYKTYIKFRKI